jgi:ribulose-phosphate 3-epimerase
MNPPFIAASILSADFTQLGEQIREAESAGVDWIHVDVMDGHFVPNLTMGPFIVEACRRVTDLPLDVHLMVNNPEDLLEAFARAGASQLTVHVETCPDVLGILRKIRQSGCQSGITLNPATPAELLDPALDFADTCLVMTVHPGYSGQEFMDGMLEKVAKVRRMLDERNSVSRLEVDGGIHQQNISLLKKAGADTFVSASAIFKYPGGIGSGVAQLRTALEHKSAH